MKGSSSSNIAPIFTTEQTHNNNNNYLIKKLLSCSLYAFIPLVLIHVYFDPFTFSPTNPIIISPSPPSNSHPNSQEISIKNTTHEASCDYSDGEWVPNDSGPMYNDTICGTIKTGQNCMAHGRPDRDYLHWKWKPKHCQLPAFQPENFLKHLENKHIAFVGDSLARNQLESMLCMMATASKPELVYTDGEDNKFRKWRFGSRNITASIYWSPFLVKGIEKTPEKDFNTLFLDSVDERWAKDLKSIDILVLSAGHWYLHHAVFYYRGEVLGCHLCEKYERIGFYDVFGRALNTTLKEIIIQGTDNGPGKIPNPGKMPISVFVTTFPPAHFEGEWDKFGVCSRTQPYKKNERIENHNIEEMRKMGLEMKRIEVRELEGARLKAKEHGNGVRFQALDITNLAFMRPDGHPGPYMNPFPFANGVSDRVQNDCVHWCLPGPIDTWNEILFDVIKRWESKSRGER